MTSYNSATRPNDSFGQHEEFNDAVRSLQRVVLELYGCRGHEALDSPWRHALDHVSALLLLFWSTGPFSPAVSLVRAVAEEELYRLMHCLGGKAYNTSYRCKSRHVASLERRYTGFRLTRTDYCRSLLLRGCCLVCIKIVSSLYRRLS